MSLGGGGGQQELQELAQQLEAIEEQQQAIEAEIEGLQTRKQEVDEAIEAIENLETDSTVQVPLGGGAYLRATIGDIDEVTVELGGGYAAERGQDGAVETLESKKETLDDRIDDLRSEVAELESESEELEQKAQQMQEEMKKAQEEAAKAEITGESGAGLVKVTMNGRHDVRNVDIDPSLMNEDQQVLEDLMAAAVNDAVRRVEEHQKEKLGNMTQGMGMPPGFNMPS